MFDDAQATSTESQFDSRVPPSFADFAKQARVEMAGKPGGQFLSKLNDGQHPVKFLGATMVTNTFGEGYIPEYRFNHDNVEKTLRSASKGLAIALNGREGQMVILVKGKSPKTGKTFWDAK